MLEPRKIAIGDILGSGGLPMDLGLITPEQLQAVRDALDLTDLSGGLDSLAGDITGLQGQINANGAGIAANVTAIADKVPLAQKGAPNGVTPLDAAGLVPLAHLNVSGLSFKGAWSPATNTPTLIDGTGSTGDFYKASVAGSYNTGNGSFTYAVGDWIIFAGGTWNRLGSSDSVAMVNGKMGNVVLTAADVGAMAAGYVAPVASVNGKSGGAVSLNAADVGALPTTYSPPNQVKSWGDITGKPDLAALYQPKQRGIIGPAIPAVFASIPSNTAIATSTETKVPFTTIRYDQFATHDGTGGFTVPSWAKYARGSFHLQYASNATGERQARMSVNGASVQGANMVRVASGGILMTISLVTAIIPVTPGQVLSVTTWQNAGASINVQTGGSTWFQLEFFE